MPPRPARFTRDGRRTRRLTAVAAAGGRSGDDGGGIFHQLPIADHETFEEWFRTPHGLEFEPTADLYGLEFARTDDREQFRQLYAESVGADGTQVIEVRTDAERNHEARDALADRVRDALVT